MLLNGLYSDRFTCDPREIKCLKIFRDEFFESNGPAAIKCMCSGRLKCRVVATCPPRNQVNKVKIGTVVTPILARAQATFALTHKHPSPPWIYALSTGIGLHIPIIWFPLPYLSPYSYRPFTLLQSTISYPSIQGGRRPSVTTLKSKPITIRACREAFVSACMTMLPWALLQDRDGRFERIKVYTLERFSPF